ncbi:MAG: hypothetical protein ACE5E1_02125 [Phycisphaerae bacterium]
MESTTSATREFIREHTAALEVLRAAKNAFFWLAVVAVLLHLASSWLIVRESGARAAPIAATGSLSASGEAPALRSPGGDTMARWLESDRIEPALLVAGFVGRASVLVVTGILVLCLLVSLSAKLGGAAGLARACVWSLVALAMLTPWSGINADQLSRMSSALPGFGELDAAAGGGLFDSALSVVRFLLCPLLVVVFLVLAQLRFRRAYRKIAGPAVAKLPIHEV